MKFIFFAVFFKEKAETFVEFWLSTGEFYWDSVILIGQRTKSSARTNPYSNLIGLYLFIKTYSQNQSGFRNLNLFLKLRLQTEILQVISKNLFDSDFNLIWGLCMVWLYQKLTEVFVAYEQLLFENISWQFWTCILLGKL